MSEGSGDLNACSAMCRARRDCGFFATDGATCSMYALDYGCSDDDDRFPEYKAYHLDCPSPPPPPPPPKAQLYATPN